MKTNQKHVQKLKDKTFVLKVIVKKEDVEIAYQNALKEIQGDFKTKGFRPGKVPINVVEQQISKEKVVEDIASKLISKAYTEKVKEYELKPIIQPQVNLKNPPADFNKDWEIELTGCELPELKLNEKYETEVKKINISKEKIDDNQKMDKTIDVLVKNSIVELPQILVDSDIQHHLSKLIEQSTQAGLTVTEYLKSQNQTLEQYKEILKGQITKEWTINLAISKIAEDKKIKIEQKEIEDIVSKNPQLSSNMNFVYYLLIQQRVFDYLKGLK